MDKRKRTYKGVPVTKLEEDVLMAMYNPGGPNLQIHYDALSVTNGCVIASYITGIHGRSIPKQVCKNLERKRLIIHNPGCLSRGQGWYWLAKEEGEQ